MALLIFEPLTAGHLIHSFGPLSFSPKKVQQSTISLGRLQRHVKRHMFHNVLSELFWMKYSGSPSVRD